jgi:hypothetical protein
MKVAICFSGKLRDVEYNYDFWNSIISKYNIDVYGSFWDDENLDKGDTVENFIKLYNPKKIEIENYSIFKESTLDIASLYVDAPHNLWQPLKNQANNFTILPMYYRIWRSNLLTKDTNIKYDVVIRARTDVTFDEKLDIQINNMLNVPCGVIGANFHKSFGINDCFAYGSPKLMDYYSFIYLQLLQYLNEGNYLIPAENILRVHFSKIDVFIRFIPTQMILTRYWANGENQNFNKLICNSIEKIENTSSWPTEEFIDSVKFNVSSIKNIF